MSKPFSKILIANRGEIALRIIRTAKKLGIKTVAIYTEPERNNLHVLEADSSANLGIGDLSETYLDIQKIISIAKEFDVEAIHPGYGFLSENVDFAEACAKNGIVFIGPKQNVLHQMGNKITAKEIAQSAGVKVLKSIKADENSLEPSQLKYPLLIKAAFGGGGKGMEIVRNKLELEQKLAAASRSAKRYFGNGEVFLEDYIENARHIEVQILGDHSGNIVHLLERDCTVQRNHQKIIEEAPATCIDNDLRGKIYKAALAIAKKVGYTNAGTVEFLVDQNNQFCFLEMNPRIQVEHPVTEEITGIDIVQEQFYIAAGWPISFQQEEIKANGHAIELRVYQEDPSNNFAPSTKAIEYFQLPDSGQYRLETDLTAHNATNQFDPLLFKLIAKASSREEAIEKITAALKTTYIHGPASNLNYLSAILEHPDFSNNNLSTLFLSSKNDELINNIEKLKREVNPKWIITGTLVSVNDLVATNLNSIWQELGNWRIDKHREVFIEKVKHELEWKQNQHKFMLQTDKTMLEGELLNVSGNRLEVKIEEEIKYLVKISLPNGQTRIGVDGLLFEVFCSDLLSHYPEVDGENQVSDFSTNGYINSHLHGKIVNINIEKNQTVNRGETLLVIESMKSENAIVAPKKAMVKNIVVSVGEQVTDGMPLLFLEDL